MLSPAQLTEITNEQALQLLNDVTSELLRRYRPTPENIHLVGAVRTTQHSLDEIERQFERLRITCHAEVAARAQEHHPTTSMPSNTDDGPPNLSSFSSRQRAAAAAQPSSAP